MLRTRHGRPLLAVITLVFTTALSSTAAALPGDPCTDDCPPPPNSAPTVTLAASPTAAHRGQAITFTATADDGDGDTLTYDWDLDGNGTYETTGSNSASRSFSTLGSHDVGVRVSDGVASNTDTETVTIFNRVPSASFAQSPASPKTLETVTFTAAGADPDGDPISYVWELDGDNDFNDAAGPSASRSFGTAGSYTVRLRVADNSGGSSEFVASVLVANRAPMATFTISPAAPTTGQTVTFDATAASDADGTVTGFAWDLDNDGAFDDGTGTTATRAFDSAGEHTVRLRVSDNNGGTGEVSRSVIVAAQQQSISTGDTSTTSSGGSTAAGSDQGAAGGSGDEVVEIVAGATVPPAIGLRFTKQRLVRALARGFVARGGCGASACTLNARLILAGKLARKLGLSKTAKPFVVGRVTATAAKGAEAVLKLRFSAKARRALGKLKSVRLSLVAASAGATRTMAVTLRR